MRLWVHRHVVGAGAIGSGARRVTTPGNVASVPVKDRKDTLGEARAALARGAWAEARVLFLEALEEAETPEVYEGVGIAARYELDAEGAFAAHERGYQLARSQRDAATAARLAIQLAATRTRGKAEASLGRARRVAGRGGAAVGCLGVRSGVVRPLCPARRSRTTRRRLGHSRSGRSPSLARWARSTSRCSRSRSTACRW